MTARRVAGALLTLALLAACDRGTRPNPRKTPAPKPTIDAVAVMMCKDSATHVRRPDFWCGDPATGKGAVAGHVWVYPYNTDNWAGVELPAVGETLRAGWGYPNPPAGLEGSPPPRLPEEGGVFVR